MTDWIWAAGVIGVWVAFVSLVVWITEFMPEDR